MIALLDNLPLIRLKNGSVFTLDENRLLDLLNQAASAAGQAPWETADDVLRGVTSYLRYEFDSSSIGLAELEGRVKSTLEAIGMPEIGRRLRLGQLALTTTETEDGTHGPPSSAGD